MSSISVEDGGVPAAWVKLMRVQLVQRQRLEAALLRDHDLSLASYDVLLQLSWARDGRLRPVDIARQMIVTQSGVTRLLNALERRGLVERAAAETDGRARIAALTDDGWRVVREAARSHVRNIDREFTQHLTSGQQRQLADLLERLPGGEITVTGPHPVAEPTESGAP